ncbi:hypothetical protein [Mesorhizobium comanense]|uniref:hypothetical protein n=1 Tax=Mesorhizobium comanense TaxID=2502215 RepID=UPI0010F5B51B|nr:hypothetical protein [Mesorhizobium comanense]
MAILNNMRALLAALVLLACSSAFAGVNDPTWNPPRRFDHAFAGKLTIKRLPQREVERACRALFAKHKIRAESLTNWRGCSLPVSKHSCIVIVVNKTFMRATPAAVIRHEVGHCNGWPANHPN